jgi:hypothetical protein
MLSWSGTCRNPDVQNELIRDLRPLARECETRIKEEELIWGPSPITIGERKIIPPAVITYDRPIDGDVLVHGCVPADVWRAKLEARRADVPWLPAGGNDEESGFFRLRSAHLRGLDFQLFNPGGYRGDDRISFVFLGCPEVPSLDGRLVKAVDHDLVQMYENEAIRAADWFIEEPGIHLRYSFEKWSDQLLAWVKYFLIPELYYWRYETFPGWEKARKTFDEAARSASPEETRRRSWNVVMDSYKAQADVYIEGWLCDRSLTSWLPATF